MITLRDYQTPAVQKLVATRRGIVQSPAGSGKTIIGAAAIDQWAEPRARFARRKMRVAWVANTQEQCEQAKSALFVFKKLSINAEVTICCYQSGMSLAPFDLVLFDECHHVAAPEFSKMVSYHEGWRWGLSATPKRADDLKDRVFELIGPIVHVVERAALVEAGQLSKARVVVHQPNGIDAHEQAIVQRTEKLERKYMFGAKESAEALVGAPIEKVLRIRVQAPRGFIRYLMEKTGIAPSAPGAALFGAIGKNRKRMRRALWQDFLGVAEEEIRARAKWIAAQDIGIYENQARNDLIVRLARQHAADHTLVIIGKVDHGEQLAAQVPGSLVVHSKMGAKRRREAIAAFGAGDLHCMFATSLADEGLDVPRANVLILAAAGRSAAKAEQRTGRVLRSFHDKTHGVIHDFMDVQHVFLKAQSQARVRLYRSLGYDITFANQGQLL